MSQDEVNVHLFGKRYLLFVEAMNVKTQWQQPLPVEVRAILATTDWHRRTILP